MGACLRVVFSLMAFCFLHAVDASVTRHYKFDIKLQNVTRLCHMKSMVTVNGQFPGPRIVAREGDRLLIKVVNHVQNNISIHWHGVRQLQTGWADGPAYITQCPIQTGQSYVYNFTIIGQRGTLFWHAHISWLRSTIYGPLIILPKSNVPYPFVKPYKEVPIIFGEWFNVDPEAVISQALQTGGGPNVSDAYTINGLPGLLYNCSAKDTFKLKVKPGKTYLLRFINAALNDELFFSIANHTLTIVEADAIYVKPFETDTLLITPGQTTNVLLRTKPFFPNATFFMTARPYATGLGTFDNSTVAAILEYELPSNSVHATASMTKLPLFKPSLPPLNDTSFATNFTKKLRSLASTQFPANVPQNVDKHFYFTVGLGTNPCDQQNQTCQGPNGTKFAASINNISFVQPTTALLQSHFFGQSNGVYNSDFPINPTHWFNYTGNPPNNTMVGNGTKVMVLPFNTSVELVMQDTSILGAESHPLHLHGFNFFVVGQGFGNFDPKKDPANFNLVDPVERNTVGVPSGGWVAIRFLLRLINAALNDELFFSIANHTLTVVEVDAVYAKPFKTNIVLITPGQTTNVLLKTKSHHPIATFLMAARPYATGPAAFDNSTTAAILEYHQSSSTPNKNKLPLLKPALPKFNDTSLATTFSKKIRSLANAKFPAKVPKTVDKQFFFTVGLGLSQCSQNQTCQGPNHTRLAAAINNVSFVQPNTALLQAHFFKQSKGVYTTDFPANPPFKFNYTGTPPSNIMVSSSTKVVVLPFNTSVELVMQDTSIIGAESHPLHLHGFNFFVVGQGFGNYDSKNDPPNFNLVDPAERNTVGVPSGGWVAIRFLADNPGSHIFN